MKINESATSSNSAEEVSRVIVEYLKERYPKTFVEDVIDNLAAIKKSNRLGMEAEVITAIQTNESEKSKIIKVLRTEFDFNGDIKFRTDANILGGMIIKIGDKIFDKSIRSSLQKVGEAI